MDPNRIVRSPQSITTIGCDSSFCRQRADPSETFLTAAGSKRRRGPNGPTPEKTTALPVQMRISTRPAMQCSTFRIRSAPIAMNGVRKTQRKMVNGIGMFPGPMPRGDPGGPGNHAGSEPLRCFSVLPSAMSTKTDTIPFQNAAMKSPPRRPRSERPLARMTVSAPSARKVQPGGGEAGSAAAMAGSRAISRSRITSPHARQYATPSAMLMSLGPMGAWQAGQAGGGTGLSLMEQHGIMLGPTAAGEQYGVAKDPKNPQRTPGGIVHTYQKYDPKTFPSPTAPPPDLASAAFEHMLRYGSTRRLTPEELANAVRLDISQIAGLGPSLDALIEMLEERKRKILATYETRAALEEAGRAYREQAGRTQPPPELKEELDAAIADENIPAIERAWFRSGDDTGPLAASLVSLIGRLGEKYQVEELAAGYEFTGREPMTVQRALEVKEELEAIDRLLEQLREAMKNAQIAIIDMEELSRFASEADVQKLEDLSRQVQDYLREQAELQGLEEAAEGYRLTPQAYRTFQGRLLQEIFSSLEASRSGRHSGPIVGEGAVELPGTKPYEFGDSAANMDIPQSFINAMLRDRNERGGRVRLTPDDIEIHRTRNNPKAATAVLMDMSGSMRYDGQYMNVKRMALALDGLIKREYPGDFLSFIEMYSFARPRHISEVPGLMPKPVTIHQPVVRLKADMSRPDMVEALVPPHFTNIQHALRIARQHLGAQDTPNKQVILLTDGLPTAHFEGPELYLLYPPDPRTEEATMREALLCRREGITINIFLLPSWWQTSEDVSFAHTLAEHTGGRVFFTAGSDVDRYVLWDYVSNRRKIIG